MSFRWAMSWFIFSEVMFFAAFFGALFYARVYSLPWLGDVDNKLLWPEFARALAARPARTCRRSSRRWARGASRRSTRCLLLSSGVTVTWAHWALKKNNRRQPDPRAARSRSCWASSSSASRSTSTSHAYSRPEPQAHHGRLRLDLLHAHRLPRLPRDAGRDHADVILFRCVAGPLHARPPLRASRRCPGTGTSWTWSGCCSSCSSTGCRRAAHGRAAPDAKKPHLGAAFSFRATCGMRYRPRRDPAEVVRSDEDHEDEEREARCGW